MNDRENGNTEDVRDDNSFLMENRLFIGFNDDILDILWIPSTAEPVLDDHGDELENFSLAMITNSSQIKIMNNDFTALLLTGHSDIVLAADVSPDG